ncbi:MAG TPA: diphosphomevalonate decarboxylase [Saprospiraceae bacterium]|nr:diphosphomevalonate decarboxylase [Saprospiraceae bacterium]
MISELIIPQEKLETGFVHWQSPSNIAIIKYWGKHGQQLPQNPSLSFTLQNALTETKLSYAPKEGPSTGIELDFWFEEQRNEAFGAKVAAYLTELIPTYPFLEQLSLKIETVNSFPHSAGIASSASSMSALALCLCSLEDHFFGTLGDDTAFDRKASHLARLGSGSASRSIYAGASVWGKTDFVENSSDLYAVSVAERLHPIFTTLHDDILIVSAKEKAVSSRAGHALMNENPYAPTRYAQANQRLGTLLKALEAGDLEKFGEITENEALTLHGLMMTSHPSYLLMEPQTISIIRAIRQYRAETKIPVFFTLDAGPNVHMLYPEEHIADVRGFVHNELAGLLDEGIYIPDFVGEGPEEV